MEIVELKVESSAGLDVHSSNVVACVLKPTAPASRKKGGQLKAETKSFATHAEGLRALRQWLTSEGVTHVGMESTGVYWMPVYAELEHHGLELIVGNATHIKNVPGRKTDVSDARWLAWLVRNGLIRASYVPPPDQRELRQLLRLRTHLVEQRTSERNRLQQILAQAGITLATVVSDCFGKTGMQIVERLAAGETDPEKLVAGARGALRDKLDELKLSVQGRLTDHLRFELNIGLKGLASQEERLQLVEGEIEQRMAPYELQRKKLVKVPGLKALAAAVIVAEIGVDMKKFQSASRLASWAGVCPGNNESAGKPVKGRGSRTRPGNIYLKSMLVEAAQAAVKAKGTYWEKKFNRLRKRRGYKKAIMAIAHKLLVVIYKLLSNEKVEYEDRSAQAEVAQTELEQQLKKLQRLAKQAGLQVELRPQQAIVPG